MACDVSGPHGFLTEHGGILLENSTEGILRGMELYAEGKARTLCLDYHQMNRKSADKTEALIEKALGASEKREKQERSLS